MVGKSKDVKGPSQKILGFSKDVRKHPSRILQGPQTIMAECLRVEMTYKRRDSLTV